MQAEELFGSLSQAIKDVVNNQSLTVNLDHRLVGDLGLESIDLLDVSSELENTIGKELDFKEVAEFLSQKNNEPVDMRKMRVSDVIEYLSVQR